MNKNIRKIVAIALTVSAFSAIAPATNINLMTTKVYAASDDTTLSSLKLKTSSGSTIKIYSDDDYKSKNEIDSDEVEDNETYYAKTTSDKVKISTSGPSSSNVRVFKGTSSSTKGSKASSSISLSSGTNTLTVRVYSEDPGSSVKYKDDEDVVSEYKIKVKCTASSSSDDDDETGDVYLKSISLSDGDISFSKKTTSYNINVAESIDEIKITAKPDASSSDYDDYTVTIDGTEVDDSDNFKKTVSLSKGKNAIKITVEDDYDETRTYTLNINRGGITNTNTNTNTNTSTDTNTNTTIKADQWVNVNGRMQYNDSLGNPLKNQWFYDRSVSKYYYLGSDGYKATGWLLNGNKWYYLDGNGVMQTGWQYVGGSWYMLDASGSMLTGWYKDFNGKWYYLQASGAMAKNTTIGGYKLGSDGAWVR